MMTVTDWKRPIAPLLLSLSLGLAWDQPAWSQTDGRLDPEAQASMAGDVESAESCAGNTLEVARCYVAYRETLVEAESALLDRLHQALAQSGPPGTDYSAAATSLRTAEDHWRAYMRADCDIVDNVFGRGTALGLAGEDCVIRHSEARNEELRDLESNYFQP